jgi:hypothetical protein
LEGRSVSLDGAPGGVANLCIHVCFPTARSDRPYIGSTEHLLDHGALSFIKAGVWKFAESVNRPPLTTRIVDILRLGVGIVTHFSIKRNRHDAL